ncbi:uncharacterized protein LOC123291231 [Chrysoperla carnea]|uniref:uncharacterized protein LOC123291231 n=1 Tax=Chrysoperla carnea TaxID=189513 RepID=UPI001D078E55|nr:uncharacterized protein LOC123291231 [Chrysoperla carnea]
MQSITSVIFIVAYCCAFVVAHSVPERNVIENGSHKALIVQQNFKKGSQGLLLFIFAQIEAQIQKECGNIVIFIERFLCAEPILVSQIFANVLAIFYEYNTFDNRATTDCAAEFRKKIPAIFTKIVDRIEKECGNISLLLGKLSCAKPILVSEILSNVLTIFDDCVGNFIK